MKLIYASDLDRTLIFSKRFLEEYPTDKSYTLVETKDGKEISYMDDEVKNKLLKVLSNDSIKFIPITTRSLEEYNRINLGFIPKYAIICNGGTILENGVPIVDWENYIRDNINPMQLLNISMNLEDEEFITGKPRLVDGKYIFGKTAKPKLFDAKVDSLRVIYPDFEFTRQRNKIYAIPKCFNKAIALRWMQHYLNIGKLVASGDSELDLPMLGIADYAIVPKHGILVEDGFVESGRIVEGGIRSALETFNIIEDIANAKEVK